MSLSKTHYCLLSTVSTQEDLSRHDRAFVDWDVKNQNKQILLSKITGKLEGTLCCIHL